MVIEMIHESRFRCRDLQQITAILTLFFILFLNAPGVDGEEEDAREVLIGNELRDIEMDEDHVWIAIEKGVNRYDRKRTLLRLAQEGFAGC